MPSKITPENSNAAPASAASPAAAMASTNAECKTCPLKNTRNSDGSWKFSLSGVC